MSNMTRTLMLTLAIIFADAVVYAGVDRFTNISPRGAVITGIFIDTLNPSTIYAVSPAGIFRSRNGGESWTLVFESPAPDPWDSVIGPLAIVPSHPSTVYAALRTGEIWKTDDGGDTWAIVDAFRQRDPVLELAVDPSHPETVYAMTRWELLVTSDGGRTWTSRTAGLPAAGRSAGLLSLAIDPSRSSVLYVGTHSGLYVSRDGGRQWTLLNVGEPMRQIAVDPNDSATIYGGSTSYVNTTRDEGKTWSFVWYPQLRQIVVDPVSSTTYVLAVSTGPNPVTQFLMTTDRGVTWKPFVPSLPQVTFLAIEPGSSTFYAASRGTLFKSDDSGKNWRRIDEGLNVPNVLDVAADPSDPSTLLATTERSVLKSTDGGNHWSDEKLEIKAARLAVDPQQPSTVFALGYDEAARSADGGETWTTIKPGKFPRAIAVDPSDSATVYAILADGLARSADGGFSWTAITVARLPLGYYGFDGTSIAVDPKNPANVYASGAYGIIKSADRGVTWQTVFMDPSGDSYFRKVLIDPRKPSTVYALDFDEVYRSENAGQDWRRVYSRPVNGPYFVDLEYDPGQPSRLYLATSRGLLKSPYRGDEWTEFSEGLPATHVNSVTVDSAGAVYAATMRGLFVNLPRHDPVPTASTLSVSLRTQSGNSVSARECGGTFVDANAIDAGPCETFVLRDLNAGQLNHGDAILLQADDGAFVVAERGGRAGDASAVVNANRGVPAAWETFIIRRTGGVGPIRSGDSITLQSSNGSFVAADGGGRNGCGCDSRLTADRAEAHAWETFVITIR